MSIQAFTNKRGRQVLFVPTKTVCSDGWSSSAGGPITGISYKPETPSYPEWISSGAQCFKKPSAYERYVFNRTDPRVSVYDSFKNITCQMSMSEWISNGGNVQHMPGLFDSGGSEKPTIDNNALNHAVIECYLQIKQQKASIGNQLAEAKQTVDMIAQTTSTLVKSLLLAKKGKWSQLSYLWGLKGRKKAALPANLHLQGVYGWGPLMSDIADNVDLLKKQFPQMLPLFHAEKAIVRKEQWSLLSDSAGGKNSVIEGKGKHVSKVNLWVTVNADPWRQAALQLGLDDPAGILWEVTPYSFVVDWVVPVGDFLSALSVMRDLTMIAGSYLTVAEGVSGVDYFGAPGPQYSVSGYQTTKVERFGMIRSPMSSLPMPLPYVKSPFSTAHVANAIALVSQLLSGKR